MTKTCSKRSLPRPTRSRRPRPGPASARGAAVAFDTRRGRSARRHHPARERRAQHGLARLGTRPAGARLRRRWPASSWLFYGVYVYLQMFHPSILRGDFFNKPPLKAKSPPPLPSPISKAPPPHPNPHQRRYRPVRAAPANAAETGVGTPAPAHPEAKPANPSQACRRRSHRGSGRGTGQPTRALGSERSNAACRERARTRPARAPLASDQLAARLSQPSQPARSRTPSRSGSRRRPRPPPPP